MSNEDFDAGNFDLIELFTELRRDLRGDATGTAIGNIPVVVERAEVASDRDVVRAEFKVDAQSFQNASTDLIFQRVVPKQAEMSRSAARTDPWRDATLL